MNPREVVVTSLSITKAGQIKHFQVKLPNNTKQIIGVELGGRWRGQIGAIGTISFPTTSPFPDTTAGEALFFKRNALIGEVRLQSCEKANIFFAGELKLDNNMGFGVFAQSTQWKPKPFTQQMQWLEETVVVDGKSTIIQGVYKDCYGTLTGLLTKCTVNVYVWTETEQLTNSK